MVNLSSHGCPPISFDFLLLASEMPGSYFPVAAGAAIFFICPGAGAI